MDAMLRKLIDVGYPAMPPLSWTSDPEAGRWSAVLPDGRSAVIERLAEGDENGQGAAFLPAVHESRLDFAAGPVCDGILAAAQWCAKYAAMEPQAAAEWAAAEAAVGRAMVNEWGAEAPEMCRRIAAAAEADGNGKSAGSYLRFAGYAEKILAVQPG